MSNEILSDADAPNPFAPRARIHLSRRALFASGAVVAGALGVARVQAQEAPMAVLPHSSAVAAAFLMYDRACASDFSGAWEVFRNSGPLGPGGFHCFTVGPARIALDVGGLSLTPQYSFSEAPRSEVIVVPGRNGGFASLSAHAPEVEWLRRAAGEAQIVLAIGSGAFLLAESGLLEGRRATTHHTYLDEFQRQFPSIDLERDKRFVDTGDRVTTGGYVGGIDAALHVVARRFGPDSALRTVGAIEHASDLWFTNQLQPGSARAPAIANSIRGDQI